jgi:hypothetical protein
LRDPGGDRSGARERCWRHLLDAASGDFREHPFDACHRINEMVSLHPPNRAGVATNARHIARQTSEQFAATGYLWESYIGVHE